MQQPSALLCCLITLSSSSGVEVGPIIPGLVQLSHTITDEYEKSSLTERHLKNILYGVHDEQRKYSSYQTVSYIGEPEWSTE